MRYISNGVRRGGVGYQFSLSLSLGAEEQRLGMQAKYCWRHALVSGCELFWLILDYIF